MADDAELYAAYTADAGAASNVNLTQLQELAERQKEAERAVEDAEKALEVARQKLKDIAERQVPELMDQIGVTEFRTRTGLVITVEENIRASIPKARTAEAFQWLVKNDSESLIKRSVSVAFGKGEADKARELEQYLARQGYAPENDAKVNPQTLSAWVREKLRNGKEVPLDLFGVFRQRFAKIQTGS